MPNSVLQMCDTPEQYSSVISIHTGLYMSESGNCLISFAMWEKRVSQSPRVFFLLGRRVTEGQEGYTLTHRELSFTKSYAAVLQPLPAHPADLGAALPTVQSPPPHPPSRTKCKSTAELGLTMSGGIAVVVTMETTSSPNKVPGDQVQLGFGRCSALFM